jgi:RNA polymerase sigma-70 factor, ECF subfamily
MTEISDEELVRSIVNGAHEHYRELVERYQSKLLRYTTYLIRNETIAEDAVQEAFIKAYRNLNSFNTKKKFSSWIYRIAHNEAMNAINAHKREIQVDKFEDWEDIPSDNPTLDKDLDRKLLKISLGKCLIGLKPKYRDPLTLHYLENKSYEEISEILHIPVSTAGVRLSRAKKLLKNICIKQGIIYEG